MLFTDPRVLTVNMGAMFFNRELTLDTKDRAKLSSPIVFFFGCIRRHRQQVQPPWIELGGKRFQIRSRRNAVVVSQLRLAALRKNEIYQKLAGVGMLRLGC